MSVIGNNSDTLLHTLSDFWLRFFRDIKDVQALFEGTEILLGQAYLNLLSDVLNTSLVEAPLFRKEYFKLFTIREDQLVFRDTGAPAEERYVYIPEGDPVVAIPQLQNTIFSPTAALDEGIDYRVIDGTVRFFTNPTAPVLPGYATRDVAVSVSGAFTCSSVVDWTAQVRNGDRLIAQAGGSAEVTYFIQHVTKDRLYISNTTPIPAILAPGYAWRIERTLTDGTLKTGLPSSVVTDGVFLAETTMRVAEIAMWAVDVRVDENTLYRTFGHLFTDKRASSEIYRAFLRGVMQLYVMGPAIDRIESALNVVANFPVIKDEGEVLKNYTPGLDASGMDGEILAPDAFTSPSANFTVADIGGFLEITGASNAINIGIHRVLEVVNSTTVRLATSASLVSEGSLDWEFSQTDTQTVETDRNTYSYPRRVPMRADVKDVASVDALAFRAFEVLTEAVVVLDYIKDPQWWHTITIPESMLPDLTVNRRVVSPALFPNVIGPASNAHIGDAGYYIGADEYGRITSGAPGEPPPFRHLASFILMDQFLKLHTFVVRIDQSVDVSGALIADMQNMLNEIKPAHAQIYFQPLTSFRDYVAVLETLAHRARLPLVNTIQGIDNTYRVGSTFPIGYGFRYTHEHGSSYDEAPADAEFMPLVIGGQDPSVYLDAAEINYIDRPLHVYARNPIDPPLAYLGGNANEEDM